MTWSEADIPDQRGRVALVTGANGGLGLETARALAAKGARVLMAARDQGKADEAQATIRAAHPDADLTIIPLDLGSLASVRDAADTVLGQNSQLDLLVNNAGVMAMPERRTEDGFEMQLGVNHLGHWALTARLLPLLVATPAARIVNVTSTAHHMGRSINPDNPHLNGNYGPWKAYGQSKLANFHFTVGLQRRLTAAGHDTICTMAHPGLSNTDLQARTTRENEDDFWGKFFHRLSSMGGMVPSRGALSQLRAATDPAANGGDFYGPLWVNQGPPVKKPIIRRLGMSRAIDRLWEVSEKETNERLPV